MINKKDMTKKEKEIFDKEFKEKRKVGIPWGAAVINARNAVYLYRAITTRITKKRG